MAGPVLSAGGGLQGTQPAWRETVDMANSKQTAGSRLPCCMALTQVGVFANYHNATLALDDFALFAHGFNGRSYLHTV